MPTRSMQYTYPVPVAAVIPAAALAAQAVNKKIRQQTPTTLVARGSWLRLFGYPVTVRVAVAGVDGAASVTVQASSFGFGPLIGHYVDEEASEFVGHLTSILQGGAVQTAAR